MRQPNVSRRAFLGLAGGLAASSVLAGCGTSSSDDASETETDATKGGGTITAGMAYSAQDFDPATASSALAVSVNRMVVEGLYGLDLHDGSVSAELAAGDPVQVDETTYEVSLRSGATFSDGTAVTADDVADSFARTSSAESLLAPLLAPIAAVQKKDDATLSVTTTVPNYGLLRERLSIVRVTPASSSADARARKPVGSGPWMYDSVSDSAIELVPNPSYGGTHPAQDARIRYEVQKDGSSRTRNQQDGSTLASEMVTGEAIGELEQAGCVIDQVTGFGSRFLMFNVAKEPWSSASVRQAVLCALDYDRMVDDVFLGMASAPRGFLPESSPDFHEAATQYTHDPDRARALIEEAGVTPGDLTLLTTDNEQVVSMASQIERDLADLGFSVTVTTDTAPGTYRAIDGGQDFDLLLAPGDPSCFGGDADAILSWWFGGNAWMTTRCPWSESAEYQQLVALLVQARNQSDDERQQTWAQCLDLLAEQVPLYPVLHVQTCTASWRDDPSPKGAKLEGFLGTGAPGLDFFDCVTLGS